MPETVNHAVERCAATVADMEALGAALAPGLRPGLVLFFHGDLGAGKTTFVRGILRGLGYTGAVKSPTFTLVEPYSFAVFGLNHFDLYRLNDPEELEFLGLRDYLEGNSVCLIEWAGRGAGRLPVPDVDIEIKAQQEGRVVRFTGRTPKGAELLRATATGMDGGSAKNAGTVSPW